MKNLFSLVLFVLLLVTSVSAQEKKVAEKAKKNIKTEFFVNGVCGQCEKRIVSAALIKGVKTASWNRQTQILKVIYNRKKTSIDLIHQSIADVGHDTKLVKAPDDVYGELPGCCMYRDGIEIH